MKKLLSLFLATVMMLSLVACGKNNDPPPSDDQQDQPTLTPAYSVEGFETVDADGNRITTGRDATGESELDAAKKNKGSQQKVTDTSVFSEELLMAGSTAKQAEVAAKQIYRIRESRLNILTGEADNLPPDGEAMKLVIQQLEEQEKALTNLFTGILTKETEHYEVSIIPHDNLDKEVLFRFSKQLGIVDADDLGGTPVYMNLKATERAPILDAKEAEKKDKSLKGIVYNVPGKASIEILMNKKTLYKGEAQITQFGTREGLAPVMFEDKKAPVKVLFYPETGAIKQIIQ